MEKENLQKLTQIFLNEKKQREKIKSEKQKKLLAIEKEGIRKLDSFNRVEIQKAFRKKEEKERKMEDAEKLLDNYNF